MRLSAVLPRPLGSILAIFVSSVLLVTPTSAGASAPGSNVLAPGDRLWASRYNGPADGSDAAQALGVSPDGSVVFVTGQSEGEDSDDYATVAYDAANGTRLWVAHARGIAADYAHALAVSPTGAVIFVTGLSWARGSDYDYATVAYDAANGERLWVTRYDGPATQYDAPFAVGVSPDGSVVFVTGYSSGGADFDYATVAYAADTGAQLWASRYNGPANDSDAAYALGVSPDGSVVFVTGNSMGSASGDDYATVAYTADTGAQLWASRYNGPANGFDSAYALGVSPDGSAVFVTGSSRGGASSDDYATVAYTADTGAQLWAGRYNGPANGFDSAYALGVSPDGSRLFVTGDSPGEASGNDYATVAYAADTGAQLWATRYNGPANGSDSAYALGVSPDGSELFVTGITWGGAAENDYATVSYNSATGVQLWATRARAHGDEYAIDLGVSPTGTAVYVTGFSEREASAPYDFGTVAYEA